MTRAALERVARLLPVLAIVLMLTACSDFWVSDSSVQTLTVSPNALILKAATTGTNPVAGDTYTLSASGTTVGGTTSDYTDAASWTSSATSVVTASANGVINVVATTADQTAVITAKDGATGTCSVLTYTGTAPSGSSAVTIDLPNGLSTTVSAGQTFQLKASASLSNNPTHDISNYVTWTSNNPAVATISSTGLVTVLSTATTGDNFYITATATFASGTASGQSSTFSLPLL